MMESQARIVDVAVRDGVVTLRPTGNAVEEREASSILSESRGAMSVAGPALRAVVLDLGDVGFINSSGLAACIEVRGAAESAGAKMILYRATDDVIGLLHMVKVDRLFTLASDETELETLLQ